MSNPENKADQINKKLKFWQQPQIPHQAVVGGDTPTSNNGIKYDAAELTDPNKLIEAGLAWEHEWGKAPPQAVSRKRQEIIAKGDKGQLTDPREIAWYQIISVDTDDF